MYYSVEIGSGTMICISGFIKIALSIQRLMGRGYTYGHTESKVIS
jgi:hypothetical protein